jgi:hypothetical protein
MYLFAIWHDCLFVMYICDKKKFFIILHNMAFISFQRILIIKTKLLLLHLHNIEIL